MFTKRSRRAVWWFPAGALTVAIAISAAAQTPVGSQFQVNTYTPRDQSTASVAMAASGAFVVVWQSQGSGETDGYLDSILGQRYSAGGAQQGGEFQVNTNTIHDPVQRYPSVGMDADGDFVVVWESLSGRWNVNGRRFTSNGSAQGPQFLVTTYPDGNDYRPSVAMDAAGDFVVVWDGRYSSPGTDSSEHSVQGQRFASNGSTQGARFQVNTYTTSTQFRADVAAAPDGDFVVVWYSHGVQGQRYASDGSAQGGEFQVNTYTTGSAGYPSVEMADDGNFAVSWMSQGSPGTDSSGWSIQARRFASDGAGIGNQFQVNTYTPSNQYFPELAAAPNGDFIVVWFGKEPATGPGYQIEAQRFAANGSALGTEFRVNTYTNGQTYPAVAMTSSKDFVVAWNSIGPAETDTDGLAIQAQLFAPAAVLVPSLSLAPRVALAGTLLLVGACFALRRRSVASRHPMELP